jgi:SAM-dependent methyltransferase
MSSTDLPFFDHRWRLVSRLRRSLRTRGFASVCRRGWRAARSSYREWRLGIQTGGSIVGDALRHDAVNFGYQPIPYDSLDAAFQHIHIRPQQDVFLDYGCGMGRALVHAARHSFRRVVGIELSAQLCRIANANLARARKTFLCQDVSVIEADAARYVPPDDVTVVFMFNPFDTPVVQDVLEQLHASLRRKPRDLSIIYGLPKCRPDALADTSWLSIRREVETIDSDWQRLVVYESKQGGPLIP